MAVAAVGWPAAPAGRGESPTRPARHGAIGHRATEPQRKPKIKDSLCLGVSVARFSVSRSPWDDCYHGLPAATRFATAPRVAKLTRDPTLKLVASLPLAFATHHPQAMVKSQ